MAVDLREKESGFISEQRPVRIAVLVVSYYSAEAVGSLLRSIRNEDRWAEIRVEIVDNSCDATEFDRLNSVVVRSRQVSIETDTYPSPSNCGYAGGNNLAWSRIERWKPDVVFVVNPDVEIARGSIIDAARQVLLEPNRIFGAVTQNETTTSSGFGAIGLFTGRSMELATIENTPCFSIIYPSGHFIGLTAEMWVRADGFCTTFFLFSEEADLAIRLKASVDTYKTLERFALYHVRGYSTGSKLDPQAKSSLTYFHATRSRILLFRRHFKLWPCVPLVVASRLLWGFGIGIRVGPHQSREVFRGVWSGVISKREPDE